MRTHRQLTASIVLGLLWFMYSARAGALCPGDCNGDGRVTSEDLLRTVTLALGAASSRLCPPSDANADGQFTVDEVLTDVNVAVGGCPPTVSVRQAPARTEPAGPLADGSGVLPNGRRVEPTGVQVPTETLPLNMVLTNDGSRLVVTNDGHSDETGQQYVQVIDTATRAVSKVAVPHFFGLALTPQGDRVFVGSDNDSGPDRIDTLRFVDGALVRDSVPLAELPDATFPSGLAVSPDGTRLFAVGLRSNTFVAVDLASGAVQTADKKIGNLPYAVVVSADGTRAYVSSWGLNGGNPGDVPAPLPPLNPNGQEISSVAVLDISNPAVPPHFLRYVRIASSLRVDNRAIFGASHPSALRLSPDGTLLYVTASDLDLLVVLETTKLQTVAEVDLNVFDDTPLKQRLQGLYPNAIAVSADGRRVYVADAGINAVQVLDVDPSTRTFTPAGFIPSGWYPSALALSADGKRLYVANGKGNGVGPNGGPEFDATESDTTYIGELLKGSVSIIDAVDQYDLAAGTQVVIANNGLAPVDLAWTDVEPQGGEVARGNPVPIDFGSGPSDAIKYVVFILKENRTYDQVLGDLGVGNGDPSLVMFGSDVTPNAHALATEFATGDNFFNDGEVSTPGHEWVDQANCNDFIEKLWPSNYDRNLPSSVLEQGQEGFAKGGYIFESLERQGVPFRVYGETLALLSRFAAGINGGGVASIALPISQAFGSLPSVDQVLAIVNGEIESLAAAGVKTDILRNQVWPNQNLDYPSNILASFSDVTRAEIFRGELDQFAAAGTLPTYMQLWLPNDHTFAASPEQPSARSSVADNDAGLGMVVEALTHSPFWPHMAIFVTEDDAQDGQDHVSAHRTISLVISPYVKRGYVSHVHHSNVSMSKTIELLLGVHALSQFDRHATDMRDYFTSTVDLTPFTARPRQVPFEINPAAAVAPNPYLRQAAELSETLNLQAVDEAGEGMSRVLWLVHIGQQVEDQKAWAMRLVVLMLAALVTGGAWLGRRRVSPQT